MTGHITLHRMRPMIPQWIIEKKRDGQALTGEEIRFFIEGYTDGSLPDYQMAALAMAIYFRGMTMPEIAEFTDAMMRSGSIMDTSRISRFKADKHSTGGIGDKVSLVLAPLAACCNVAVPMISGRGLGITGGTLDKLEAIPGYRTDLSADEFVAVVNDCACSIIGQTEELAPADKKLYALRDVTGTVPSIPLISASIMSKKLAEGIDALVLDVKWGRGAFMKTREEARELARTMVEIGFRMSKDMTAVLTNMDQPLGRAAGNAVEVCESVAALRGQGPADLMEVTLFLAAWMLLLAKEAATIEEAQNTLQAHIDSGAAFDKFREMVGAQGGDVGVLENTDLLPQSAIRIEYAATASGCVRAVDADKVGRACLALGAGRQMVTDPIDHAVGVTEIVKIGEAVDKGRPVMVLHANDQDKLAAALAELEGAVQVSSEQVAPPRLIGDVIRPDSAEEETDQKTEV